ncbi:MAG: GGDEF domain-containing protein [Actinobacteria bacterium]|nr:GGDEF domain-containing protein [Actinomycetota bacterium]
MNGGLVCADLTPANDWPDEPGSNIAGHAQALLTIVESAHLLSGLTVSVGVATFPDDAALMEELADKADWAMHLAKRPGHDRGLPCGPGAHEQTSGAPATK